MNMDNNKVKQWGKAFFSLILVGIILRKASQYRTISNVSLVKKSTPSLQQVYVTSSEMLTTKEMNRMKIMINSLSSATSKFEIKSISKIQQDEFMTHYGYECGKDFPSKYFTLEERLQVELWKFCVLYTSGGIMIDSQTLLLQDLIHVLSSDRNYAVLSTRKKLIHSSSLLRLKPKSKVAREMLDYFISDSDKSSLESMLYTLILNDSSNDQKTLQPGDNGDNWHLLQLQCPFSDNEKCTLYKGFCCFIQLPQEQTPSLLIRHPIHYSNFQSDSFPAIHTPESPYIAHLTEQPFTLSKSSGISSTPNIFHLLLQNDCLPTDRHCHKCLRSSQGSCETCADVCSCYCKVLCNVLPETKFVAANYYIHPPLYQTRYLTLNGPWKALIPPIIHQTWFEAVDKKKYPNMSRLIESFAQSGLEYYFYDDDAAETFLKTHFPPSVFEAYNALLPGAFKADLFRYCVLLIHGGIYADMDVLLSTNLQTLFTQNPDIGFIMPIDEPGTKLNQRMCVWNGLIATAPANPILAKVIEIVVNNIRNRFTGVDYDNMFCPTPNLSLSHTVDMLLTTGPCILGVAINTLLGKHGQSAFEPGEIHFPSSLNIPGRTLLLHQNKDDMGSHRFTFLEQNIIVASTDMPDYEDRVDQKAKHYSKTRVRAGIYGLERLYKDDEFADEEIRFIVSN